MARPAAGTRTTTPPDMRHLRPQGISRSAGTRGSAVGPKVQADAAGVAAPTAANTRHGGDRRVAKEVRDRGETRPPWTKNVKQKACAIVSNVAPARTEPRASSNMSEPRRPQRNVRGIPGHQGGVDTPDRQAAASGRSPARPAEPSDSPDHRTGRGDPCSEAVTAHQDEVAPDRGAERPVQVGRPDTRPPHQGGKLMRKSGEPHVDAMPKAHARKDPAASSLTQCQQKRAKKRRKRMLHPTLQPHLQRRRAKRRRRSRLPQRQQKLTAPNQRSSPLASRRALSTPRRCSISLHSGRRHDNSGDNT